MSSRRFARTTSAKRKGRAYGKGVGLGLGVLLALTVISLAVWLLRRSASDESTSATPEPGESVEAGLEEQEDELRDYERLCETSQTMIHAVMSRLMLRRLARA